MYKYFIREEIINPITKREKADRMIAQAIVHQEGCIETYSGCLRNLSKIFAEICPNVSILYVCIE